MNFVFDTRICPRCSGGVYNTSKSCYRCDGEGRILTRKGQAAMQIMRTTLATQAHTKESAADDDEILKAARTLAIATGGARFEDDTLVAEKVTQTPKKQGTPRANTSHKDCDHETTPKARAACRKARQV